MAECFVSIENKDTLPQVHFVKGAGKRAKEGKERGEGREMDEKGRERGKEEKARG